MNYNSYSYLGIKVNKLTQENLIEIVKENVEKTNKVIIGHHNLHSVYLNAKDKDMKNFYRINNFTHIDGMPIVWIGKLLGYPLGASNRLTSLDWINPLFKNCNEMQYRIFFLGSKPGVSDKAKEYFKTLYPELQIKTYHGYFDKKPTSKGNNEVIKMINEFQPNILMVGMGMPIQEKWIIENHSDISANVIWSLGAFMDYFAGVVPTPPRWMGKLGIEWLFRLIGDPKRLFKRYLVEPWFILYLLLVEIMKKISISKVNN